MSLHFSTNTELGKWKAREGFIESSVVQIRMSVNVSMGSGGVGVSVSMHSVGSGVSGDEEDKDEDEELAHDDDDEQDVDEINHTQFPKETVRDHSPRRRTRGALV